MVLCCGADLGGVCGAECAVVARTGRRELSGAEHPVPGGDNPSVGYVKGLKTKCGSLLQREPESRAENKGLL